MISRYNLINNLLTNIFYPVYNQVYVFENSIPYYYYYSCEIPFLFKYNISNPIIYPVYTIGNNYYINYSLCVPIIPLDNFSDKNNNIFYSVANTVEKNLNEEIGILNFKYANFPHRFLL
ncbi:hypothetical protein [Candidatus Nanopusillus massiliensis]|uniref:hypothetical protein n=1 Tax=Candidatus Nanopusillus massiliensis TaxID=2897163 RepID=UPI001E4338C7|nr:hypothetical protein [Candidatus Nanopusillus massiliensis]